MKSRSNKTAAIYRKWTPIRIAYLAEFPFCMVCGATYSWNGFSVHEMTPGSNRMLGFVDPAAWLATCNGCNQDALTDPNKWPLASQLALKLYYDPTRFDLAAINRIHGCNKVTAEQVLEAFRLLHAGQYFAA
jgi:hypothetical protein